MPSSSPSDQAVIFEGTYTSFPVPFSQYLNQEQDFWKSESNFFGSHWSFG